MPGVLEVTPYPSSVDPPTRAGEEMTAQQTRTPFLGREAELATLVAGLDDADAGRGGLVLLGENPASGRAASRMRPRASPRPRVCRLLGPRGRMPARRRLWIQILRGYLRQTDPDDARRQLGPGAADIAHVLPEVHELLPELPPPQAAPESDAARFQLFDSTATFLRGAAESKPMLIVLDDLQAADTPSLRLLLSWPGSSATCECSSSVPTAIPSSPRPIH